MASSVTALDLALRRINRLSAAGQFVGASDRKRALIEIRDHALAALALSAKDAPDGQP